MMGSFGPCDSPGQPGQHAAEHLCRRQPGAGHPGGNPGGGGDHRSTSGHLHGGGSEKRHLLLRRRRPFWTISLYRSPRGHIVGITGRSGSGKSTLLKLFMRFWETQQGRDRPVPHQCEPTSTPKISEKWRVLSPRKPTSFTTAFANNLRHCQTGRHRRGNRGRLSESLCA